MKVPNPVIATCFRALIPGVFLRWAFLAMAVWAFAAGARATQIIYVSADAAAGGSGTSWSSAYNSLSTAITAASPTSGNPVEIWITKGTYKPGTSRSDAFRLKSYLTLRGGFRGDETSPSGRNPWANPTVLSGDIGTPMVGAITSLDLYPTKAASTNDAGWQDNCYNVLVGNGVTSVTLEYLTITGGSATDSTLDQADIDAYQIFSDEPTTAGAKSTVKPSSTVVGGGLYFTTGQSWSVQDFGLQLFNCTFARNRARGYGGALAMYDGCAFALSCTFDQNVSDGPAGAFWGLNQESGFAQCSFTSNTAGDGGGAVKIMGIPSPRSADADIDKFNDTLRTVAFSIFGVDEKTTRDNIGYSLTSYGVYTAGNKFLATQGGFFTKAASTIPNPFAKTPTSFPKATGGTFESLEISPGARVAAGYAIVQIGVAAAGAIVAVLDYFGKLDKTSDDYKRWVAFNDGFNRYATPNGLISLGVHAAIDAALPEVQPDFVSAKKKSLAAITQAGRSGFISCDFTGNKSGNEGGAIELVFNNLLVEDCTFIKNNAWSNGGAISSAVNNAPQLVSSVFSGNTCDTGTSAISNSFNSLMLVVNCTIVNNRSSDKKGKALTASMGADVRVYNSILWNNKDGAGNTGADVEAVTAAMLNEDALKRYNALQGEKINWVGIMDIRNTIIQSLATIPLGKDVLAPQLAGTNLSRAEIDAVLAAMRDADSRGELESVSAVNVGEGIRPKLRDPAYGNSAADPLLLTTPLGKPSRQSPANNAGNDHWITWKMVQHGVALANITDAGGKKRILNSRVDIGAYEVDSTLPDTAPLAGTDIGDENSTAAGETGIGADTVPTVSATTPPGTPVYYVKPVAAGDGTGSSWANATSDLQAAMSHENSEVWVAAGTYKPTTGTDRTVAFSLSQGVKVFGGFAGNETTRANRSLKTYVTIISGDIGAANIASDNSKNLFRNAGITSSTLLDGFTLRDAYSNDADGGAIYNNSAAPFIRNCIFRNNHARNGGAIYSTGVTAAGPVLVNCEFRDNFAEVAGGAVCYTHSLYSNNVVFSGNTAATGGGAISATGSVTNPYCTVQNGLFYGNASTAAAGGAIKSSLLYLNVVNSTFYGNTAAINSSAQKAGGGAIAHDYTVTTGFASAVIYNSIFYKNTASNAANGGNQTVEKQQIQLTNEQLFLHSSLVQGLNTYPSGGTTANFTGDPLFVSDSDFHLQAASLAIDSGDAPTYYTEAITTDLDGNARTINGAIDLGPYEHTATVTHPVKSVAKSTNGTTFTFTATYTAVAGDTLRWYVDRGDGRGYVALTESDENKGVFTAALTVSSRPTGFAYSLRVTREGVSYFSPVSTLEPTADSIARYVYVKPTATGTGDGSSWVNATGDLQGAIARNAEVWVAAGTYTPGSGSDRTQFFALGATAKVYGGFVGTETTLEARDWRTNKTIISGEIGTSAATDNIQHLFRNTDVTSYAVLDGLYFQGAYGDGVDGGAILNVRSNPAIQNCVFQSNYARNGGAIYSSNTDAVGFGSKLFNCEFRNNTAELTGGAIAFDGSLSAANLLFKDNAAQTGGAIYTQGSLGRTCTVQNGLFTGNLATAGVGGAAWASGMSLYVINSTFYANQARVTSADAAAGGAIYFDSAGSGVASLGIYNSILYKNTALNNGAGGLDTVEKQQIAKTASSPSGAKNSLIQGLQTYTGNGNFDGDPLFVQEGNDFHVSATSLTIDSGATNEISNRLETTDLDGNNRIIDTIDLGPYEHAAAPANPIKQITAASDGLESYSYTASAYTAQTGDVLQWYVDRGDGLGFLVLGANDPGQDALPDEYLGLDSASLTVLSPPSGFLFRLKLQRGSVTYYSPVSRLSPTFASKAVYFYVRTTATGDGSGSGWANATSDLQAAISIPYAQVWVQEGTYLPTSGTNRDASFSLARGVRVYGGFKGTESLRDARNFTGHVSRISGNIGSAADATDNSRHLFRNENIGASTILDGFTLQDAYADGVDGGAILNVSASPTIQNCVFQNNYARNGAAIASAGTPDSLFGSVLANCKFKNNTAELLGGALSYSHSLVAENVIFQGNKAGAGGAINLDGNSDGESCTIKNGLFSGNRAQNGRGGAIFSKGLGLTLINSTLYNNQSTLSSTSALGGGAVYQDYTLSGGYTVQLYNSIFYANTCVNPGTGGLASLEYQQVAVNGGVPVYASHSLINGLNEYRNIAELANFDDNPLFVDAANDDFHLSSISPAINSGVATEASRYLLADTDLDGSTRVQIDVVDLGPYEFAGSGVLGKLVASSDFSSGTFRFSGTVQAGDVLKWYVNDGHGYVALSADGVFGGVTYSGVNSSTLSITSPPSAANGYLYRLEVTRGGNVLTSLPGRLTLPPARIYVNAARLNQTADGTSWSTAYGDLAQALQASGAGTEIWVAAGTYHPSAGANTDATFQIPAGVAVYGGFLSSATSLSDRNPTTHPSILSGKLTGATTRLGYSRHVVTVRGATAGRTTILDGFALEDAYSGLMLNDGAAPTVRNCIFRDNDSSRAADGYGAAISNLNAANPLIAECQFLRNTAVYGAAVYLSASSARIENSLFASNTASGIGGALYVQNGTLDIVHCTVADNTSQGTVAALYAQDSTVTASNSIFWHNRTSYAGWTTYDRAIRSPGSTLTFSYSCVEGAVGLPATNVTYDPIFDPLQGSTYALARFSPLVNAASSSYAVASAKDLAGNARTHESAPDIGAYELQANAVTAVRLSSVPRARTVYNIGGTVDFTVSWPAGTTLSPNWVVTYANFTPLDSSRYTVIPGSGFSTIRINNLSVNDTGIRVNVQDTSFGTDYIGPAILTVLQPRIVRVNPAATGANNGTSWADAYTDLVTALNNAQTADEIWVVGGTYTPVSATTFNLKPTVGLYGGFAGTETDRAQRNTTTHPTMLHASGSNAILTQSAPEAESDLSSTVDGFILENSPGAAAVYNAGVSTAYRNCIFRNNAGYLGNFQSQVQYDHCEFTLNRGNLFVSDQSTVTVSDSTLHDNTTTVDLFNANNASTVVFTDTVISSNTVAGALIRNSSGAAGASSVTLLRSAFRTNTTGGGIIDSSSGNCAIESCLFAKNIGSGDFATVHSSGPISVRLSTFADNRGGSYGGGLALYSTSVATVNGCIFWGNRGTRASATLEAQQINNNAGTVTVQRSIIEGLATYTATADRNTAYYPFFTNPAAANYRLPDYSPAIDMAESNPVLLSAQDLDKVTRRNNSGAIGAYEFSGTLGTPLLVSTYPSSIATSETTATGFTYVGQGSKQWQYYNGTTWVNITSATSDYRVITSPDGNTSTLYFDSPAFALNATRYRLSITFLGNTYNSDDLILTVNRPRVIYVNGNILAAGNGSSWSAAFKTVQQALAVTNENAEIWVQAGAYTVSSAFLNWNVHLYGGFAGNETLRTQRNASSNETTLQGNASNAIFENADIYGADLTAVLASHPVLDGFTLTGATNSSAVRLSAVTSAATVSNCTFRGNAGGIAVSNSASPTITNCVFDSNIAALALEGRSVTVSGCTFRNNGNRSAGATVYVLQGSATITDSVFTGNTSSGSIVSLQGDFDATLASNVVAGKVTQLTMSRCRMTGNTAYAVIQTLQALLNIDNSLVAQNTVTSAAILGFSRSMFNLTNVTVADNTGTFECAGIKSDGKWALKNSIVWGNRTSWPYGSLINPGSPALVENVQLKLNDASTLVQNSTIQGAYLTTFAPNQNANSGYDPLFVDASTLNYQLLAISPAINQGTATGVPATTLDLASVAHGTSPDMGAYEFTGTAGTPVKLSSDLAARKVIVGQTTTYTVNVPAGVNVQWQVKSGSGSFTDVTAGSTLTLSSVSFGMTGNQYRFVLSGGVSFTSSAATLTVVAKPIVYVNVNATGNRDGTSWADAFVSITDAASTASNAVTGGPRELWVAQGTYAMSANTPLFPGVEVYGGFAGNESTRAARNIATHPTIITRPVDSTAIAGTYILSDGFADSAKIGVAIDGFTFTGSSSGLYFTTGPAAVRNCTFTSLAGVGLTAVYMPVTVEDCTFDQPGIEGVTAAPGSTVTVRRSSFRARLTAGAATGYPTNVTVEDSVFQNNPATTLGSTISVSSNSTVNVTRCRIVNNTGGYALSNDGTLLIRDSLIAGNAGGGLYANQTTSLANVTIAGNDTGIWRGPSSALSLFNTIIAKNTKQQINSVYNLDPTLNITASHTLIEGQALTGNSDSSNVKWDPLFTNAASGDYTLSARSPGIDAGTASVVLSGETDLLGAARTQSTLPDLGAYESANTANPLYRSALPTSLATTRGVDGVFTLTGASTYTFTWQYYNGSAWVTITYNSATGLWVGPNGVPLTITTINGVSTLTVVSPAVGVTQFRVTIDGQGVTSDPFTLTVSEPEIMYVDGNVVASGNGKTWSTAFKTLTEALANVIPSRRIIYVAKGTYKPAVGGFALNQRAEIYGGFPNGGSAFGARSATVNPVILSGELGDLNSTADNASTVLGINALNSPIGADTIIDGLTLTSGKTGLTVVSNAQPTLRNLIVSNNTAGGLSMSSSGGRLENCQFLGNSNTNPGGGATISGSTVTFTGCSFRGNTATSGGGLYLFNGTVRLENAVISGNKATSSGGGVEVDGGTAHVLVNSTVVGNAASEGSGLYVYIGARLSVSNSILWANRASSGTIEDQQLVHHLSGGSFFCENNDIEGLTQFSGGNNLNADPLFFTAITAASAPTTTGDFHLYGGSPVTDKGNDSFLNGQTLDADGAPRLVRTVDLGAYEIQGSAITLQPADLVFDAQGTNQYQVQIAGGAVTDVYQWETSTNGTVFTPVTNGASYSGAQTATLTLLAATPAQNGNVFRVKITATGGGVTTSRSALLTVYPTQYYVNGAVADDNGDGYAWATAFKTIGTALTKLRLHPTNGAQVWVAAGTYVPSATDTTASFPVKASVALYGGFAGTETTLAQRNVTANPTILAGISGANAVFATTGTTAITGARIDGFTLSTATTGISLSQNVTLTVANCTFSNLGIGLNGDTDLVTVQSCQFTGLTQYAIVYASGSLTVADAAFTGNKVGIAQGGGSLSVLRSAFRGNGVSTTDTGAVRITAVGATFESCLFSGNTSSACAGLKVSGGTATVRNCTFAGNYGTAVSAARFNGSGIIAINNSIFWGNTFAIENSIPSSVFYNNDVPTVGSSGELTAANGNISVDPLFTSPVAASAAGATGGDYRPTSSSPVINKGSNALAGTALTDLALGTRTFDTTIDIGAYEFQAIRLVVTTQPADATAGIGVAAIFSAATNGADATYRWQVSLDGGATWTDLTESTDTAGVTTTTLTVAANSSFSGRLYRLHATSPIMGEVFSNGATYRYASVQVTPPTGVRGATLIGSSSTISFTVAGGALASSIVDGSFAVHASQTGRLSLADGTLTGLTVSGSTVTMQSAVPFKPGELVEVTSTSSVQRADAFFSIPLVYQFRAGNLGRTGAFLTANAISGAPATARALASGDLNRDGSIDLVVGGTSGAAVWLNNGTGTFTATSQTLGTGTVSQVLLGSLGMTGTAGTKNRLDIVLRKSTGAIEIWKNEGDGSFTNTATISSVTATSIGLADLNGDGALDLFIATAGADQVWFNNGTGTFTDSTQRLGTGAGASVTFGDFNLDGFLDVATANGSGDIELWTNDGSGHFSGSTISSSPASWILTADLDRDGKTDLVTISNLVRVKVYKQFGSSLSYSFPSVPTISVGDTSAVSVGDLDGDGLADIVNPSSSGTAQLWKGQGYDSGLGRMNFAQVSEQPTFSMTKATELADVNGDGMMDLITINSSGVPVVALYVATPLAPTSLAATATSDTKITLAWTDNATNETAYTVERSPNGNNNWTVLTSSLAADTTSYTDTSCSPSTTYYYRVKCGASGVFFSSYSNTANATTRAAVSAGADSIAVLENGTATMLVSGATSVLANDSDADAGTLEVAVLSAPAHGTLTLNTDGTFSYTPTAGFSGSDSFTYRVTNLTTTATATGTVSIAVTRLNGAPVALTLTPTSGTHYTGQSAGEAVATLSATDADPEDAGQLTYSLVSGTGSSGNADFTIAGTSLKTANAIDASSGLTRSVRIRVTDTLGLYSEDTFTVTFTQAPTALAASLATDEDTPLEVRLSGVGGASALSYQIVTSPSHGTLVRSALVTDANAYTYTPAANYNGSDSFTYRVLDSNLTSAAATVTLTIAALDDAPTLDAIAPVTTVQNTPVSFTLVGHDIEGDTITSYQSASTPTLGTVQLSGAVVTYTPNLNTLGTENVAFTVTAGGKTSAPLQVSVTITAVPVASTVYRGLYEYTDIPAATSGDWTGVVPANISTPAHGTVTFDGTRLRYNHNGDSATSDSYTYTLTNSANDVRTISVALTIKDRTIGVTSTADSGANTLREALATVARFVSDTLAPAKTTAPDWLVQINTGAGSFIRTTTYFTDTPANGFSSAFQIQGNVTIDASLSSGFALNITQGNPPARNFVVPTGSSLTLKNLILVNGRANSNGSFTSTGGLVLNSGTFIADHVTFKGGQANTGSAIYNKGGTVTLTDCSFQDNFFLTWPDTQSAIVASRNGSLTLTRVTFADTETPELYVLGDGTQATVNVSSSTVGSFLLATANGGTLSTTGLPRPVNDSVDCLVGQTLSLPLATLLANDLGSSAVSVTVDATTAKGVTLSRSGDTLSYQVPGSAADTDSFNYTVTDAAGLKATATVTLVIKVPSTTPVATADTATVYRGLTTTIDVLANDTNPGSGSLTISAVSTPVRGTAQIVSSGTRILYTQYDTAGNQSATSDTFTYTVTNSSGSTANIPVTVTINERVIEVSNSSDSGGGTIRAALGFIGNYKNLTVAPANTTPPDWTIKIVNAAGQRWVTTSDDGNQSFPEFRTCYRVSTNCRVTIDASASSGFELLTQPFFGPNGPETVRHFLVESGASLTLKNLNLIGSNFATFGAQYTRAGAVLNYGTFIADHVVFNSNRANLGAAIYNDGGTLALTDCELSGNTATSIGADNLAGIVATHDGTLSFTRVNFADSGTSTSRPELYVTSSSGTATFSFTSTLVPNYRFDGNVAGIARALNNTVNRAIGSRVQIPVATLLANDTGPGISVTSVDGGSAFGIPVSLASGVVTYDTNAGYIGDDDAFNYTITDSIGFTSTATVFVHTNINTAPTLATIANRTVFQNASAQTVSLTGITAGTGETQSLTFTATSDNPDLIPDPVVTYSNGSATGSLVFTPATNATGTATITVYVQDDGGTDNGGADSLTRSFIVTVAAVNQAPTLDPLSDVTLLEDAGTQGVDLTGISAGYGESQTLTVTAASSNTALIPHPTVNYSSPDGNGSINYTPTANASGTATITVTVTDNGGTANTGVNVVTRSFVVTVLPVNDAPTLAAITNPAAILQNAGAQTVNLSGIGAGGGESQTLAVTAISSNTALIPNPTVTYTSPSTTGSLSYTPVANASGTATITVTVTDSGGTANGGVNTYSRTFTVTVTPLNRAPTLNAISDPTAILEDATAQTVSLAGISAGTGETTQTLTVTATSSNTALIPHPTVTYTSPNTTGSLSYTPVANASGTAIITVTVKDNGGTTNVGDVDTFSRTFTVTVTSVNDAPTLNAIASPTAIAQDSGQQTIAFDGITAGGGETGQVLTVTATSDNTALIPNPTVTYTSAQATGSLRYTPVAGASGTAVITVRVQDDGGILNGGVNFTTRTFTVAVTAADTTPPTLAIAARSGGGVTLTLTGTANTSYAISLSTNLLTWSALATVTTDGTGSVTYIDTTAPAEGAARFYRAVKN